jgi:hypothetical protein
MRAMMLVAAVLVSIQGPPAPARSAGLPNAISGRVTGPDGAPIADAIVTLLVRENVLGRQEFHFANVRLQVPTDADGRYRIDETRLGEFFVVAIPHNAARAADGRPNRSGYRITYYPSAATVEQAMPVVVNTREPQIADIRMIAAPLATVSGTVVDSKGAPAASAPLDIAHGDHLFGIDNMQAHARPDGTFALGGFPPGTYYLQFREGPWPGPRDAVPLVSAATVVIDGQDVTGVRIAPIRPVHAEGHLVVNVADRPQLPADLTVGVLPQEGNAGHVAYGTVQPDLSFAFDAWPLRGRVRVLPENGPWRVIRVRYRGADVTETGIDFKEGEAVKGIEIEFGRR